MKIRVNQFYDNVDCPREFTCAHCGAHVYVTDTKDKRVKYCSATCEKQYWRDKSKADAAYKKRSKENIVKKKWLLNSIKRKKKQKNLSGKKEVKMSNG